MIYFHFLLYAIAFVYACSFFFGKRKKMIFLSISGVLLVLFLGLRDVEFGGIDLFRYNYHYEVLSRAKSFVSAYEVRQGENFFFFLLMYLSSSLGLSFQQFLFIIGAFSVLASLLLFYRYSKYALFCVCMFLPTSYIHLFSQLKQTLAVAIVIFAYMLFRKDKMLAAYSLLTVAILFHPTALVMIPFFILCKYRANPFLIVFLFIGSFFIFLLRMEIGYFLTFVFYDQHLDNWNSREGITGMAILFMFITFSYLFVMPKRREVSKESYLITSSYLYVLIMAMSIFFCASFSYGFTRLNNYFMAFVPLAISEIAEFGFWKRTVKTKIPVYVMFGVIMYVMVNWFLDMVVLQQLDMYKFYWM